MSVQTEIDRISTAVQNAHLKVIEKGGTSAAPYLVANLPDAIDTIPEATEPKLQAKSATPSETAQTVKPDSGYDGLSQVSVGAISKTYVGSSVPKQAAQTITPGTADKTIASGSYLTGTQTIKGDSNLVSSNIKSGVSIFGVAGTMTAGEDVTAETNTYTSLLDDLEAAVDALPDAGSGGSGGTVQMCTVTIKAKFAITATGYVDYLTATGYASEALPTASNSIQIQCLANSILTLGGNGFAAFTVSDGAELIRTVGSNSAMHTCIVYVTGDSTLQYGGV